MSAIQFPVEEGQILLFARAIGDDNPIYRDLDHAQCSDVGGIIAPPTFTQASAQYDPDYRVRPTIGRPWFGSGREPSGVPDVGSGDGRLHAEQHFDYARPVHPGEVLRAVLRPGRSWEKTNRHGRILRFSETVTEFLDADGSVVVVSRSVVVETNQDGETA